MNQYTALLTFAQNNLENVAKEQRLLQEIFQQAYTNTTFQYEVVENASEDNLRTAVNRCGTNLRLFHYGGHANQNKLVLGNKGLDTIEFTRILKAGNAPVDFIFLNGCNTYGHAMNLLARQTKAIIITNTTIDDASAMNFAKKFYKHFLLEGGQLQKAFEAAVPRSETGEYSYPHIVNAGEISPNRPWQGAWTLLINADYRYVLDWTWADFRNGSYVYNQKLTKQLSEAAAKYSVKIQKYLEYAQRKNANWECKENLAEGLKEQINAGYIGVLGVQFRKLMAIGKETDSSVKPHLYIKKTINLLEYSLDLLNFILLASLWDANKTQRILLHDEQRNVIHNFFTGMNPLSILERLELFKTLLQVFDNQQLTFPLPELEGFLQTHLDENQRFHQAVEAIYGFGDSATFKNGKNSLADVVQAETHLITIYSSLAFLVQYKMASIKSIHFKQSPRSTPNYLHQYVALGIDSKANIVNAEKIYFTTTTAETDSILVYKDKDYQKGINITPFAFDYNALKFRQGALIYFFSKKNENDLDYVALDKELESVRTKTVKRIDGIEVESSKSDWLKDTKNQAKLNFNILFDGFQTAQKAILGASDLNDLESDFS